VLDQVLGAGDGVGSSQESDGGAHAWHAAAKTKSLLDASQTPVKPDLSYPRMRVSMEAEGMDPPIGSGVTNAD
jgi:hypothetical protein